MNSPEPAIIDQKRALRQAMRGQIMEVNRAERAESAGQAISLLTIQPIWKSSRTVLLVNPLPDELDLSPLFQIALDAGKTVCAPGYDPESTHYRPLLVENLGRDLVAGKYGILEPASDCPELPLKALDFLLVPGLAFDTAGCRLGRGKGHYDRLLSEAVGWKCGFGYGFQVLPRVPTEPHDIKLDSILTPVRWIVPCHPRS